MKRDMTEKEAMDLLQSLLDSIGYSSSSQKVEVMSREQLDSYNEGYDTGFKEGVEATLNEVRANLLFLDETLPQDNKYWEVR